MIPPPAFDVAEWRSINEEEEVGELCLGGRGGISGIIQHAVSFDELPL